MASLSRGLLFPCRPSLLRPRPQSILWPGPGPAGAARLLSAAAGARAGAAPGLKPLAQASAQTSAQTSALAATRYAFLKKLAAKPTPTVLYQAPSHFWFYFGCWASGLSLMGWTALTAPALVRQPEGVPRWVETVYGLAYLLLCAMGCSLIAKTVNIVSSIRLLPAAAAAPGRGLGAAAAAATKTASPRIEVTVKRMLPLLSPKVVTTSLDRVALKTRFSLPEEYVPQLRRVELQQLDETRRAELQRFDMEHILTMPFRRLGRLLVNMFQGFKAAWSDVGYGNIRVDGSRYKVDVTRGFSHDGFRTLERIVSIGW